MTRRAGGMSERAGAGWTRAARALSLALLGLLPAAGCENPAARINADDPDVAAFVELVMPRKIEIQHYLTRPVSFAGDGNADGIEVILAALDSFGDPVKCVGVFQLELNTLRMASGDRLGERIALWSIELDSREKMSEYWDRLARFHRFPLKLAGGRLEPGKYILTARISTLGGQKLFDEYQFTHEAGVVPSARGYR